MLFDRRWLISFMTVVLVTQTYKRLQKLKWWDYQIEVVDFSLSDKYWSVKLACYVLYLKIIDTFFKTDICIL